MGRQGVRSDWRDVPATVRRDVDAVLGSPIVATRGVQGGFSPGPAVRADLPRTKKVVVMVEPILARRGRAGARPHLEAYAPTTVIRRRTSEVVCVFATMSTR